MFSDGARIVDERIRSPLRIRCVHWVEEWAQKRDSLQGRMSWIESGTVIGPVERNEEYQESRRSSPMIILGKIISGVLCCMSGNCSIPLGRLDLAPGFPSHINIGNCFEQSHVKDLSFSG